MDVKYGYDHGPELVLGFDPLVDDLYPVDEPPLHVVGIRVVLHLGGRLSHPPAAPQLPRHRLAGRLALCTAGSWSLQIVKIFLMTIVVTKIVSTLSPTLSGIPLLLELELELELLELGMTALRKSRKESECRGGGSTEETSIVFLWFVLRKSG